MGGLLPITDALFRFTFPENEHSYVVIDAFDKGSYVKINYGLILMYGHTTKLQISVKEIMKILAII